MRVLDSSYSDTSYLLEARARAHILDNYAITSDGITIYVEVIYDSSRSHFRDDLLIIERSKADLIFTIVNPDILENEDRIREYQKTQASKRKSGTKMSSMINGDRILTDTNYVNFEFKQRVDTYLMEKRSNPFDYINKFDELKYELENAYSPLFTILNYFPDQVERDVVEHYGDSSPHFSLVVKYDKKVKNNLDNILENYGYLLEQNIFDHWQIEIKNYNSADLEKWFVDDILSTYHERKKKYDQMMTQNE